MRDGLAIGDGLALLIVNTAGDALGAGILLLPSRDISLPVNGTGSDGNLMEVGNGVPVLVTNAPTFGC